MQAFWGELMGTCLLIALGNGIVANALLAKTKGNGGGLIAICFGWAMAVFVAVYMAVPHSGAHLNPAVTLALASMGKFQWQLVPIYLIAQLLGAILGALLVWLIYKQHFDATTDAALVLACFATSPAIQSPFYNFLTEALATALFMIGVLSITPSLNSLGALNALPVALLVLGIGLSFGGPTGYAINPARDAGPRIVHALLPIKSKGSSEWNYSWIPIAAPIVGGIIGSFIYSRLF